jgi:hypothetical protein
MNSRKLILVYTDCKSPSGYLAKDCRCQARKRGLTILGPRKIRDW